ncbi:uncharacterized protein LOC127277488 isoform X2 [Leptopilina boulardi]|uniref:uncharacterized protein LOC127277488 isoform X2 n=1 Tax=Leptopilina boulardi TaxID=63433 RepID=UPI0021F50046|nr:uncharacterized protein LOC127277488 isoform X2 [Leptopilina boulardi]
MNISTFVSPLDTVQIISIFTYVNTLSDFLFSEKFLNETDQYKYIPIVNALYHYLDKENNLDNHRKIYLVKKLINNTDLYGAKENEIPDPYFINTLINHIVNSLVFDRFTNVYGFIVETMKYATNDSFYYLMRRLKKSLIDLKFENQYGEDSKLDINAIENIFRNIIQPLFPCPRKQTTRVTSIDYIYAQAGKMFLKSGSINSNEEEKFQEYIETAHTIEQLVLAKKVNEEILKIFALPALVNYMYNEKSNLKMKNTAMMINSEKYWLAAYKSLFSRLNEAFFEIDKIQNDDYRYQFYLALSSIKNRTTLARETININCPELSNFEIDQEVTRYKNEPSDYRCNNTTLENLNLNFKHLIDNISKKYYNYEKESCREAFGKNFIDSINKENVIITKGLIHYPFGINFEFSAHQLVKPSDDLFEFYYPDNETFLYFALIRKEYNVILIKESDNPILFRQKLGLNNYETLKDKYFPITMKENDEEFEIFLSRIASQRSKQFEENLQATEYDQTRKEWWKDFGLSLIPFYSCIKDIGEKNLFQAGLFCSLDVLFFLPIVGEVGTIAEKMTTNLMKSVVSLTETTMRTVTLRNSLRTSLRITGKMLILEIREFSQLFTRGMFRRIGVASLRFIDPGFELLFHLGKGNLGLIRKMIVRLETVHLATFTSMKLMLDRTLKAISEFPKMISRISGKDIWVNSLITADSGYGYKFIYLKGEKAEIRRIYPMKKEFPVVERIQKEVKLYEKVDIETEELVGDGFFNEDEGVLVSEERVFETKIVGNGESTLEGGNIITNVRQNLRRKFIQEAINFAVKRGKSEIEVQKELKKYTFRKKETELNFVQEWLAHPELKTPHWAEELRIEEPDLFYKLKTKLFLDYPEISIKEATRKILHLYPRSDYPELLNELSIEKVLYDFKEKEAYKHCTFEDYYALRNYGASGYKKMGSNCHEARRMKNAIYRLAIRQSEELTEECVGKLFRGEKRITESIEKDFYPNRETIELQRFTSTSTDINTADIYSETLNPSFMKVMYTINFNEPYLRARVEHLFVLNERETILLPGTELKINKITRGVREKSFGAQKFMNIELSLVKSSIVESQQRIMRQIKKLMETDTVFYAD